MKRVVVTCVVLWLGAAGCAGLRFAPGDAQKQNAYLHNRTAAIAAEAARREDTSQQLQALTGLSEQQSRAFVAYCGLPDELPKAETPEDVLGESSFALARAATAEAGERPDAWQVADSAIELGIGVAGLLGGVYGTTAVRFLRQARAKSNALKEIILGNEVFKMTHKESAEAFKQAHGKQSAMTRQIVTQMKA